MLYDTCNYHTLHYSKLIIGHPITTVLIVNLTSTIIIIVLRRIVRKNFNITDLYQYYLSYPKYLNR